MQTINIEKRTLGMF